MRRHFTKRLPFAFAGGCGWIARRENDCDAKRANGNGESNRPRQGWASRAVHGCCRSGVAVGSRFRGRRHHGTRFEHGDCGDERSGAIFVGALRHEFFCLQNSQRQLCGKTLFCGNFRGRYRRRSTCFFSFNVQGHEFKDFDVWVKAGGPNRAYIETVPVTVTNGVFRIDFITNIENPEINAIEIIPQS